MNLGKMEKILKTKISLAKDGKDSKDKDKSGKDGKVPRTKIILVAMALMMGKENDGTGGNGYMSAKDGGPRKATLTPDEQNDSKRNGTKKDREKVKPQTFPSPTREKE